MNSALLEEFTASISNFDDHRPYIGLSNIVNDAETLIGYFKNGQSADLISKLKCYKGYQMERDLVNRIHKVYGSKISFKDITAHNNLVQGHPDFWYEIFPGDCKSVLLDKYLPEDKLPRKVYWQLQGYMLYSNTHKAVCVYESRESGKIKHKWINRNDEICNEIEEKITAILKTIKTLELV